MFGITEDEDTEDEDTDDILTIKYQQEAWSLEQP